MVRFKWIHISAREEKSAIRVYMQAVRRRLLSELRAIRARRAFSQLYGFQHLSCRYLGAVTGPIAPVTPQLPHLAEVQSLLASGRIPGGLRRSLSALSRNINSLNSNYDCHWPVMPGGVSGLRPLLSKRYSTSGGDGSKGKLC